MRALAVLVWVLAAAPAHAERPLCGPNARYRGAPIDFDVTNADIHDVFRLLADTGRANIVIGDSVAGRVTMRLRRVPWDQVACTVAATKGLTITVDGNVLLVLPAAR
jgi:type IV pilus assembly protein PilQ